MTSATGNASTSTETGRAETPGADSAADAHHARRWLVLGVIGIAQLMVVLDASIVNIALPSAQHGLGFSDANRQWIITAYALAFGSLLLLGGRLSDLFGRKAAFLVGLAGFAAASAVGGAAVNFAMLVSARAAQGAFGALLAPSALALLATTFPEGRDRGKAFGIFGALAGAGGAVGLLLGGVLTEYLSWRWCMYVNLIFAGVAFVGAVTLLHHQRGGSGRPRLDLPGTLTATAGLFCVVFGFANAHTHAWGSPWSWGFLAGGVVLLALFVLVQTRVAHPLLPMRVLLDRNRGGAFVAVLLIGIGMFGVFLFLSFFLQQNLRFSPIRSGLAFLPMVAAIMTSATTSTTVLLPRFGPRPLIALGMAVGAGGMFWLSFLAVDSTYAAGVLPALLVAGLGIGMAMAPAMQTAIIGVAGSDAGVASATVNTMQQVGGSVGTALLATIAGNAANHYLSTRRPSPLVIAEAAVHSYTTAFVWGAAIFLGGAVVCGAVLRSGAWRPAVALPGEPAAPTGELAAEMHTVDTYAGGIRPGALDAAAIDAGVPPPMQTGPVPVVRPAPPPNWALLGQVRTTDGTPLAGVALTLVDVRGRQRGLVRSGADGSYRLDAGEGGHYVLLCTAPGHRPTAQRLRIGSGATRHDVVLSRSSEMSAA